MCHKSRYTALSKPIWAVLYSLIFLLASDSVLLRNGHAASYSGTVIMNIHDYYKITEYAYRDGRLIKLIENKVASHDKDETQPKAYFSPGFNQLYSANRLYRYDMEDRLTTYLASYDLRHLQDIETSFFKDTLYGGGKSDQTGDIYLREPGRITMYFNKYSDEFYPNRQLTHVVHRYSSSISTLIDLDTGRISFPFGIDQINHMDWDRTGRLIAYTTQGYKVMYMLGDRPQAKTADPKKATLVIVDTLSGAILLGKQLGRTYVSDVTWSPDSSHIAVIRFASRLGIWPWELLFAISGHPVYHNKFTLDIFDTKGTLVETRDIPGSYERGSAKLVWQ